MKRIGNIDKVVFEIKMSFPLGTTYEHVQTLQNSLKATAMIDGTISRDFKKPIPPKVHIENDRTYCHIKIKAGSKATFYCHVCKRQVPITYRKDLLEIKNVVVCDILQGFCDICDTSLVMPHQGPKIKKQLDADKKVKKFLANKK